MHAAPPHARAARAALGVLAAAALSAFAAEHPGNPHLAADLAPAPDLAPDRVVRIQLEALRNNDEADRGIEVAFRFASPANRRSTGPLPRFAHMIKAGPYRLMLHFLTADYGPVQIAEDQARQRVTLVGAGQALTYVFHLARQRGAECPGCWMTEAVTVEEPVGRPA